MRFLKDEDFERGDCPMTKEDIRILSLAKLELEEDFNCLDIGAGTGSLSIEMARFCPKGKVTAVEMDEEALRVIAINKGKFKAENLKVISGEAMEVSKEISENFHRIFIGGSGGNIEDIIEVYGNKLYPQGKMVLNFITLKNVYKAMEKLKELGYKVDITMVNINKSRGESAMMMANNPIFIIEAGRK